MDCLNQTNINVVFQWMILQNRRIWTQLNFFGINVSTNIDRLVTSITRPTTSDFVTWMTEEYHKLEYKIWFNP
jgi:hypothetical protein